MTWSKNKSGVLLRMSYSRKKSIALIRVEKKLHTHTHTHFQLFKWMYKLKKYFTLCESIFWFHISIRLWKAEEDQRESNLTGEISEKLKEEQINELVIQAVEEKPRWFNRSHSTLAGCISQLTILFSSIKTCNQRLFMGKILRRYSIIYSI